MRSGVSGVAGTRRGYSWDLNTRLISLNGVSTRDLLGFEVPAFDGVIVIQGLSSCPSSLRAGAVVAMSQR
jgi:hypothetical protein